MAKVTVVFHRDEDKIPKTVEITRGRKKLKVKYEYSPDKDVYSYTLEGRRGVLPSFGEILEIIDAMRASETRKVITIEKGEETRVYRRSGDLVKLPAYDLLCDLPNVDVELLHAEAGSETNLAGFVIRPYTADGELDLPIQTPKRDGSGTTAINSVNIHTHESIEWFELIYDTVNNYYKYGLGYPLRFSNGVYIAVVNGDANTKKVASEIMILIRG